MNTVVTGLVAERRFYVGAALGVVVVVLAGFSIDVDLTFSILVSGAIALRRRSDWHKRLMLLGVIMVLDAALARFISAYTWWGLDPAIARDGLVLLCVAIDTLRYRRLHPAFALGGLLVFVTDPLAHWAAAMPVWARFCAWVG